MVTSHLTCHSLLQKHSMVTLQISRYINTLIPLGTHLVISKFLHNCIHAASDREQRIGLFSHTHTHTHTILDLRGFPGQRQGSSPSISVTYCLPVQNTFRQSTSIHWAVHMQHHRKHIHLQISVDWHTHWATVSLPSDHAWIDSLPGTPS
jgi:hypothetical protein